MSCLAFFPAADLDLGGRVDEVQAEVDPVTFLREYVAPNKPLIIRGGVRHWPALQKWTREYLTDLAGSKEISVDVTPNGRSGCFLLLTVT